MTKSNTAHPSEPKRNKPERGHGSGLAVHHLVLLALLFWSLVGVAVIGHLLVRSREGVTLRTHAAADASQFAQRVAARIEEQLRPLRRLKRDWQLGKARTADEFRAAAAAMRQEWPVYQMVAGVDAQGICQWVVPLEGHEHLYRADLNQDGQWDELRGRMPQQESEMVFGWTQQGRAEMHVGLALADSQARQAGEAPMLIARLALEGVLEDLADKHLRRHFNIHISHGAQPIMRIGPARGDGEGYGQKQVVRIGDEPLHLHMWPTDQQMEARMLRPARWVLLGGIPAAFVLTAVAWQVMFYRWREIEQTRRHLAALESLNEISTAISARLGAGREVMDRLAGFSRQLLGMSRSGIALLDQSTQRLEIYAFSGDVPPGARRSFALSEMPASARAVEGAEILFVEDASNSTDRMNQLVAQAFSATSIILIPLQVEEQCIGLMAVSDSMPRMFTDADRRLAKLLGSQASVILGNNRLYEQTRRDAEVQRMLLRELHHRVKNSLAGIVGLLSINEPDLSAAARQWLDRVIERIRTMARAHELFSHGRDQVDLRRLVEQVLPSLSVIARAGVMVRTDIQDAAVKLDTPQAVSLAMVLHELCSNAMLHGLENQGSLLIQARRSRAGVRIDVIDDGRGMTDVAEGADHSADSAPALSPAAVIAGGGGMGLKLVRELVQRELKGSFHLRPRPGGGTVGSVEFPVGQEPAARGALV